MEQTHSLDLESGSSQYASISDGSQTGLDITGDISGEAWIKLETLPSTAGNDYGIFHKANRSGTNAGYFWYIDSSNTITVSYFDSSGNRTDLVGFTLSSNDVGVWLHLAFSADVSSPSGVFYKNGKPTNATLSSSSATSIGATSVSFLIGATYNLSNATRFYFDGLIKDVRVFSDIRTQAEIVADAHTEAVSDANLVGEWNLNNAYTDSSGNGNTLTASGSPSFTTELPWYAPAGVSDATDTIIVDDFTRADSATVGGAWTESDSDGVLSIASNKLRYTQNLGLGNTQSRIYQTITQQSDIIITGTFQRTSGTVDTQGFVGVRSDGTASSGYGVTFMDARNSGNIYIAVLDNGTEKAANNSFGLLTAATDYNFEIHITDNNHIHFRMWLASGSRPLTPTLSYTNGGASYTPTSNGTNAALWFIDGTGIAASFDVNVSEVTFRKAGLDDDVVSYWTLDETSGTREDSHSTNDLTDNNTVGSGVGILDDAADFELSNSEYLSITDGSQSGLDIAGSMSTSLWLKNESALSTNEQRAILGKYNNSGNQRAYLLSYDDESGTPKIVFRPSANGTDVTEAKWTYTLTTATLYHIVLSYNAGAGLAELFINGISQGVITGLVTSLLNSTADFQLGGNTALSWYWDGLIDEVVTHNRALHYGDVLDLYNAGAGIPYVGTQTFDQAVTANVSVSASVIKGMSKTLIATTTPSASVIKQMANSLVATATVTANMVKQMGQTLIATAPVTAAMTAMKVFLQELTATVNVAASIVKTPDKLLVATSTVTADIAKSLSIVRTLVATASVTGIVLKGMSKTLAATTSVTAAITKTPAKILQATANMTATISSSVAKVLVATATISASVVAGRAVIMIATANVTAVITKTPGKLMTAIVSIVAKVSAPFWRTKYPAHGDGEDYEIKYPHE